MSARYTKSYDEEGLQKMVQDVKPKNTMNKTRKAMNVFNSWKMQGIPDNILNMTNSEINEGVSQR